MIITKMTTPTFTTLADNEIREWLRIDPNVDNFAVSMLIGSATEVVESITGLTIRQTTFRIQAAAPDRIITLPFAPVMAVTAVQDATATPITGWTYAANVVTLQSASLDPVTVTATVGWPNVNAIPLSIRHAIAVIVAAGYDSRLEIDDQTMTTVNRLVAGQRTFLA